MSLHAALLASISAVGGRAGNSNGNSPFLWLLMLALTGHVLRIELLPGVVLAVLLVEEERVGLAVSVVFVIVFVVAVVGPPTPFPLIVACLSACLPACPYVCLLTCRRIQIKGGKLDSDK